MYMSLEHLTLWEHQNAHIATLHISSNINVASNVCVSQDSSNARVSQTRPTLWGGDTETHMYREIRDLHCTTTMLNRNSTINRNSTSVLSSMRNTQMNTAINAGMPTSNTAPDLGAMFSIIQLSRFEQACISSCLGALKPEPGMEDLGKQATAFVKYGF